MLYPADWVLCKSYLSKRQLALQLNMTTQVTFDKCLLTSAFSSEDSTLCKKSSCKICRRFLQDAEFFQLQKKRDRRYLRLAAFSRKLFWDSKTWCSAACFAPLKAFGPRDFQILLYMISPQRASIYGYHEMLWTKAENNLNLGLLSYPICLAKLSFSSRQIAPGNGFCRRSSHSTSSQWWECGSLWSQRPWTTMQHSTFRWRSVIHPNFCRWWSHSTSSQWWECGSLRSQWQ